MTHPKGSRDDRNKLAKSIIDIAVGFRHSAFSVVLPKTQCGKFTDCAPDDFRNVAESYHGSRRKDGQTEKNSIRAYVFRFALELGHCLMQSALRICANSGRWFSPLSGPASTSMLIRRS
jgi:hypothetical protein